MRTPPVHAFRKTFVASLWLGVLGSPIVWAIHLQSLYALVKFAERGHSFAWLYVTTAACFVLAVGCGALSYRDLCYVRDMSSNTQSDDSAGRTRFLAYLGIAGSAFFALVIVATGATTFFFKASWK
jgi:hypothetical protein